MRLVLVGAGHAHLYVAARADRLVAAGAQVTLIDHDRFWYSGMATGMLGGRYPPQLDQIDPAPLIESRGGSFCRERVVGFDRDTSQVQLESGRSLPFDILSLNLGSVVDSREVEGIEHAWTVKPISNLGSLRRTLETRFQQGDPPPAITVIGGGPSACEVVANLVELANRFSCRLSPTLITSAARLLPRHSATAGALVARKLLKRGIRLRYSETIQAIGPGRIRTKLGEEIASDVTVVASGLRAPDLLGDLNLPLDDTGSVIVDSYLRARNDVSIFAVGDCASIHGYPRPRLGVFGVRAAPILFSNLLAILGRGSFREYIPQSRYLSILNLGHGEGLSLWGNLHWYGRSSLWLKDYLDRRFMNQYEPSSIDPLSTSETR